jgi:hypothetical protein
MKPWVSERNFSAMPIWLVVWNISFFPLIEKNNPNWPILFRGVGQPPTSNMLDSLELDSRSRHDLGLMAFSCPFSKAKARDPNDTHFFYWDRIKYRDLLILWWSTIPICYPWCWYIKTYKTGWFCSGCWDPSLVTISADLSLEMVV